MTNNFQKVVKKPIKKRAFYSPHKPKNHYTILTN